MNANNCERIVELLAGAMSAMSAEQIIAHRQALSVARDVLLGARARCDNFDDAPGRTTEALTVVIDALDIVID